MSFHLIRSALVACALVASIGSAAQASGPAVPGGFTLVDDRGERYDRWDRGGPSRGYGWERERRRDREHGWDRGGRGDNCSSRLALRKARDMGVRGADIVRENRRAVVVAGFKRGYPTAVRFAQARGCPVIGYR